jgi:hypothetical protein
VVMMFDYGCAEAPHMPNPQSYMEPNAKYGLGTDEPFYDMFYVLNSTYSMLKDLGIDWAMLDEELSGFLDYCIPRQLRGAGMTSRNQGSTSSNSEPQSLHPCFDYRLVRPESCTVPLPDPKTILFHPYFAPLRVPDTVASTLVAKYISEPRVRRFRLSPTCH